MERLTIKVQDRAELGKGAARSLRRQGMVPAVLYRAGRSRALKVSKRELLHFLQQRQGEQVVVNLAFPNGESKLAILKDYQVEPVKGELLHTDFFEVSLKEKVRVTVAVRVVGEPIGVKRDGGVLQFGLDSIEIECLPDRIPGHIDVDVSGLAAGHSVHVADIRVPQGIKVLTPPEEVLATVTAPAVLEEAPAEEAAAPAPEEAEPEVIKKGKEAEEKE